jgi:histidinol-phosphate aminotransferase
MSDRFSFIRSDLSQLAAYISHPGGQPNHPVDRLDTNESPVDLPLEIKEKLAYLYQHNLEANRYPDGSHDELKKAIAEYVIESAKVVWNVNAKNISIGNGSDELIRSLLIATCIGGEGSVLVANPTFSMYGILATTLGISVHTVGRSEADFAIDLERAQEVISNSNELPVKVVFVVHPNSPTGNCLTPEELNWLQNLPENILVVIDEAYFEFSQTSVVNMLAEYPNWVILRTFSKAFRLASHRVGYAIGNPDLIIVLEKVRLPYNLPALSQAAAIIALQNRHLILPLVAETIQERAKMWQALNQDLVEKLQLWPSQANFFYLRLNHQQEQEKALADLTTKLKTQGTLIRHTGGGLRITVGTTAENQRTLEHLQKAIDNDCRV